MCNKKDKGNTENKTENKTVKKIENIVNSIVNSMPFINWCPLTHWNRNNSRITTRIYFELMLYVKKLEHAEGQEYDFSAIKQEISSSRQSFDRLYGIRKYMKNNPDWENVLKNEESLRTEKKIQDLNKEKKDLEEEIKQFNKEKKDLKEENNQLIKTKGLEYAKEKMGELETKVLNSEGTNDGKRQVFNQFRIDIQKEEIEILGERIKELEKKLKEKEQQNDVLEEIQQTGATVNESKES